MEVSGESVVPIIHSSGYIPEIPHKELKGLWIFGETDSKRRVIFIERQNGSYGFTLQSYGVRYKHGNRETDFITYVNAVDKKGAAHEAGLREGDVILSINGQNMARVEHKSLVGFIRQCPSNLKMVVVSDERARKVELHMRYVHLQKKLQDKVKELEELNAREKQILNGTYAKSQCSSSSSGPLNTVDASTVCCFCPPQTHKKKDGSGSHASSSTPNPIVILKTKSEVEEAKLRQVIQQRSKSVKLPSEKEKQSVTKSNDPCYYDCYRKCQSSRDLHNSSSTNRKDANTNISTTPSKHENHYRNISEKPQQQLKPKSWDSLLVTTGSTKSFGGYGYGFGYPYTQNSHGDCSSSSTGGVTHPHHHNHHSHCSHLQNHYYKTNTSASKVKVVYNYVAPTYNTILPNTVNLDESTQSMLTSCGTPTSRCGKAAASAQTVTSGQWSRTLPSSGKNVTTPTKSNVQQFPKLEKTFSDSSLSDHHKEFSKTMSYFKRSGDNVRFSSEEDFEIYKVGHGHGQVDTVVALGRSKTKSSKGIERIFV